MKDLPVIQAKKFPFLICLAVICSGCDSSLSEEQPIILNFDVSEKVSQNRQCTYNNADWKIVLEEAANSCGMEIGTIEFGKGSSLEDIDSSDWKPLFGSDLPDNHLTISLLLQDVYDSRLGPGGLCVFSGSMRSVGKKFGQDPVASPDYTIAQYYTRNYLNSSVKDSESLIKNYVSKTCNTFKEAG